MTTFLCFSRFPFNASCRQPEVRGSTTAIILEKFSIGGTRMIEVTCMLTWMLHFRTKDLFRSFGQASRRPEVGLGRNDSLHFVNI